MKRKTELIKKNESITIEQDYDKNVIHINVMGQQGGARIELQGNEFFKLIAAFK